MVDPNDLEEQFGGEPYVAPPGNMGYARWRIGNEVFRIAYTYQCENGENDSCWYATITSESDGKEVWESPSCADQATLDSCVAEWIEKVEFLNQLKAVRM